MASPNPAVAGLGFATPLPERARASAIDQEAQAVTDPAAGLQIGAGPPAGGGMPQVIQPQPIDQQQLTNPLSAIGLLLRNFAAGFAGQELPTDRLRQERLQQQQLAMQQIGLALSVSEAMDNLPDDQKEAFADKFAPTLAQAGIDPAFMTALSQGGPDKREQLKMVLGDEDLAKTFYTMSRGDMNLAFTMMDSDIGKQIIQSHAAENIGAKMTALSDALPQLDPGGTLQKAFADGITVGEVQLINGQLPEGLALTPGELRYLQSDDSKSLRKQLGFEDEEFAEKLDQEEQLAEARARVEARYRQPRQPTRDELAAEWVKGDDQLLQKAGERILLGDKSIEGVDVVKDGRNIRQFIDKATGKVQFEIDKGSVDLKPYIDPAKPEGPDAITYATEEEAAARKLVPFPAGGTSSIEIPGELGPTKITQGPYGTKPKTTPDIGKPMGREDVDDILGGFNILDDLATFGRNIDKSGRITGRVTKLAAWLGTDAGAVALNNAQKRLRANMQSLIKGVPSTFDQVIFDATNLDTTAQPIDNAERLESMEKQAKRMIKMKIAANKYTNVVIPPELIAEAEKYDIDVGNVKAEPYPRSGVLTTAEAVKDLPTSVLMDLTNPDYVTEGGKSPYYDLQSSQLGLMAKELLRRANSGEE